MQATTTYLQEIEGMESRLTDHLRATYQMPLLKRAALKLAAQPDTGTEKSQCLDALEQVLRRIKTELPVTATDLKQYNQALSQFLKIVKRTYGWRTPNSWWQYFLFFVLCEIVFGLVVRLLNLSIPIPVIVLAAMIAGTLLSLLIDQQAKKAGKLI